MIYQELLYSRSLSKDYRWMIVPPGISQEGLRALNLIFNLYDKHKNVFSKSSVFPLYCLNYSETTFLVQCSLSNHKDKEGRGIYCLQGISVAQKYKRHLWFILPWILANYDSENILNTWSKIDFHDADNIIRRTSKDCFFKLDQLNESLAELTRTPKTAQGKLLINKPTYISFDNDGLKKLSHSIASSYHDCIDFAFGATPEMVKAFNFKIIAKVGIHSSVKTYPEMGIGNSMSSPISDGKNESAPEHFDDPVDRFDPRRKGSLHKQINASKKNGSSRKFNEFLPRLLSVFKIGKRLKQRFKGQGQ